MSCSGFQLSGLAMAGVLVTVIIYSKDVHIYLVVVSLIPANFVGGSYAKYQVLLELRWIVVTSTLDSASLLFPLSCKGKPAAACSFIVTLVFASLTCFPSGFKLSV